VENQEAAPGRNEVDVLYIEDDDDFRVSSCSRLRDEGFRVAEAQDGSDALAYLNLGNRPALVILDLLMPGMDGFEFMARMRSDPDLLGIPVVVVSGVVQSGLLAGPHGVVPHLSKPFDIESLLAYVRRFSSRPRTDLD
jgi:two-component system, chemotaxis family, chemotaxis protein CheY